MHKGWGSQDGIKLGQLVHERDITLGVLSLKDIMKTNYAGSASHQVLRLLYVLWKHSGVGMNIFLNVPSNNWATPYCEVNTLAGRLFLKTTICTYSLTVYCLQQITDWRRFYGHQAVTKTDKNRHIITQNTSISIFTSKHIQRYRPLVKMCR